MIDYVDNQIRHSFQLLLQQTKDPAGKDLPQLSLYAEMIGYLEAFANDQNPHTRWVILTGLRGVGKTTLMAQLYVHLAQSLPRESYNLFYASLDEVVQRKGGSLNDLLDACQLRWSGQIQSLDRPTFLFIDEIQVENNAFKILKPFYDKYKKVFLLCSGSAATNLSIGASVAGRRAQVKKLYPLSFTEYQTLQTKQNVDEDLASRLRQAIYLSDSGVEVYRKLSKLSPDINQYFRKSTNQSSSVDDYLQTGGLPFLLTSQNRLADTENMIRQTILRDLPVSRFNFTTSSVLKALDLLSRLSIATETPSVAKLSSELGISGSLLNSILEAFCEAEILIKVAAFGRRHQSNSGRPAKYYLMSPTLRSAFSNKYGDPAIFLAQRGALLEDMLVLYLYRQFVSDSYARLRFWSNKNLPAADFILEFTNRRLVIEIGWGEKSVKQIQATLSKIKCDYGLVFSRAKLELDSSRQIVKIPLDYLLLT